MASPDAGMARVVAFAGEMLGLPYDPGGLHCWELTRRCQRDVFGRELPAVLTAPSSKRELVRMMAERDGHADWCEITGPRHGAVVFLARRGHGPSRAACHAGTWLALDGGGVLHTDEPHGVVFDTLTQLAARNWADPSFYLPKA